MRWYTIVAVALIVAGYVVIGGVIYSYLEKDNEARVREEVLKDIGTFLEENSCLSIEDIGTLQALTREMRATGISVDSSGQLATNTKWDIRTALFVSLQIIATLGFPASAPQSDGGRAFTIPFAIFGIPLFLITAIGMGTFLNSLAEFIRVQVVSRCTNGCAVDCGALVFRTIVIAIFGIVLFMIIPSIIFAQIEPWSYGDAFYFSFITLATIGFGDLIPSYNDVTWMTEEYRNWYRLAIAFWILILSSWFAGVIVSIQMSLRETAMSTDEKITRHLERNGISTNEVVTNVPVGLEKNFRPKNNHNQAAVNYDDMAAAEYDAHMQQIPRVMGDTSDVIPEGVVTRIAV